MSFRLKGELIKDEDPIKILGELVKTGIRLNGVLIYQYKGGGTTMQNILMGNFKCNPGTYSAHKTLMNTYKSISLDPNKKLVVFPQAILAQDTIAELKSLGIDVGLQFIGSHNTGAYTGQISPALAADMGITHALIHYSEHITFLGSTIEEDATRIQACFNNGITPVICVGETLEEHEAGNFETVVDQQMNTLLKNVGYNSIVLVYEPRWAIGTGKTITSTDIEKACNYISKKLGPMIGTENAANTPITFGGTVNPSNAATYSVLPTVNGALLGGSSLTANVISVYDNWSVT